MGVLLVSSVLVPLSTKRRLQPSGGMMSSSSPTLPCPPSWHRRVQWRERGGECEVVQQKVLLRLLVVAPLPGSDIRLHALSRGPAGLVDAIEIRRLRGSSQGKNECNHWTAPLLIHALTAST